MAQDQVERLGALTLQPGGGLIGQRRQVGLQTPGLVRRDQRQGQDGVGQGSVETGQGFQAAIGLRAAPQFLQPATGQTQLERRLLARRGGEKTLDVLGQVFDAIE